MVNALTRIEQINELLNIEIAEEDVETLGGVLGKKLARISEVSDIVADYGFTFTVLSVDGSRILKIQIKKSKGSRDIKRR